MGDDDLPDVPRRPRRRSSIQDVGSTPEKQIAAVVEYIHEVKDHLEDDIHRVERANAERFIELRAEIAGDGNKIGLRQLVADATKQLHSIATVAKVLTAIMTILVTLSVAAAPFVASAIVERALVQHGVLRVVP